MLKLKGHTSRGFSDSWRWRLFDGQFQAREHKEGSMRKFKIGLRALAFLALLPVSAIAQTPNSGLIPEKLSGDMAALSKKALAGDTRAQLQLGIAFEFGQGVDKNFDDAIYWYRMAADRG